MSTEELTSAVQTMLCWGTLRRAETASLFTNHHAVMADVSGNDQVVIVPGRASDAASVRHCF